MALTRIDPNSALVLIDLQKGIVSRPLAHPVAGVLANAAALADRFRARGLPVVLVNVAALPPGRTEQQMNTRDWPEDWTVLVPELKQQESDLRVTKRSPGAFAHTELEAMLRGRGVTQIVLGGVATGLGVESTARAAFDLGFNLTFAVDAMTDMSAEVHENSVTRIFPRLGETGRTAEILALIGQA